MPERSKLKLALVGLRHGHVGSFDDDGTGYIATFKQMDEVEIVAYCDETGSPRLDEAREHHPGASIYESLEDLITREEFDVACVALPARDVPAAGVKLAEAGKHFYMEKQFARTAADLVPLVKAVRRNGVKVLPGYPWRFHPVALELRRIIDDGPLGRPADIELRFTTSQVRPGSRDPDHFMYGRDTEGGGVLHMLGGHYIELMRFLAGCDIRSVQAMTSRPVGYIQEPLEDLALCVFEFESGVLGSLRCGYLAPKVIGTDDSLVSLVYRGVDGWADWTPIGSASLDVKAAPLDGGSWLERTFTDSLPPKTGYGGTVWMFEWMRRFMDDIQADREPALNVEDALRVLQTIDAAYESARTGRRVEVKYGI